MALNGKFGQVAINDGGGGYSAAINRRRTRESEEAYDDFYSRPGIFTQGEIIDYAKANGLDGEQLEGLMNLSDRRRKLFSAFVGGMTADTSDLDIIYGLGRTTSNDFSDADVDRLIAYRDWLKNNAGMPSSYEEYLKNHAGSAGAGTNSGTNAGAGTGTNTNTNTGAGTAGAGTAGSTGAGGSATDAANAYYDAVFGKTADYAGKQRDTTVTAAQEYYDYITGAAGKDKAAAIRAAEAARERGIVDASTAYRQMLASYGANAEKLAGMGLTGSGYSDYLSGKAYATSRAEAQNANKEADAAVRSAESSYSQALGQAKYNKMMAEADAENTYSQALLNAEISRDTGKYEASTAGAASAANGTSNYNRLRIEITGDASDDDIAAYADEYGFTPEQVSELTRIRNEKKTSAAESTRTEGFNSARVNITADTGDYEIEAAAGTYGLSAEQKQELYRIRDEKKKQEDRYALGLDSDSNVLAKADEMLKSNTISQEEAHSIYDSMIYSAIASATKDDIETLVKELYGYKKAGKITAAMYSKYLAELGRVTSNLKAVNKAKKNAEAEDSGGRGGQVSGADKDRTNDDQLTEMLNKASTGDANKTPGIGTIATVNGKSYRYTELGWDRWYK